MVAAMYDDLFAIMEVWRKMEYLVILYFLHLEGG